MNYKIFTIFIIIFLLTCQNLKESFSTHYTHILVDQSGSKTSKFELTNNIIHQSYSNTPSSSDYIEDNGFLNLYTIFGQYYIKKNNYDSTIGTLVLESYEECPTLYNLYRSLPKYKDYSVVPASSPFESKMEQNESVEGVQFRNLVQSKFFNVDQTIETDYQILDLEVKERNKNDFTNNTPKLYFEVSSTQIPYLNDFHAFDHKESSFGVKENFQIPDILNFMDFAFTTTCWGALNIKLLESLDNHYYGFPCQNEKCNSNKFYFYLLPVRIRQVCLEENKSYTRAKCNNCGSNIIVYFHSIPRKFINLRNKIQEFPSPTYPDL